jgi:hypothetical protein
LKTPLQPPPQSWLPITSKPLLVSCSKFPQNIPPPRGSKFPENRTSHPRRAPNFRKTVHLIALFAILLDPPSFSPCCWSSWSSKSSTRPDSPNWQGADCPTLTLLTVRALTAYPDSPNWQGTHSPTFLVFFHQSSMLGILLGSAPPAGESLLGVVPNLCKTSHPHGVPNSRKTSHPHGVPNSRKTSHPHRVPPEHEGERLAGPDSRHLSHPG